MIKKHIKYHDYEENEREDDFYFHLTKVELEKINAEFVGGIQSATERATKNNDAGAMLAIIDKVISRSYGMQTPEGGFVKRNASGMPLYESFVNTEAYDNLLTELISGGDRVLTDFLMGCLTASAREELKAERARRDEEAKKNVKLTAVDAVK